MTARVLPQFAGGGLARMLVQATAKDLTRRGIRAIEAFGLAAGGGLADRDPEPGTKCLVPADLLLSVGFKTVRPHHRYPRLRLRAQDGAVVARGRRARARAHPRHRPRTGPDDDAVGGLLSRRRPRTGHCRPACASTSLRFSVPGARVVVRQVQPLDGDDDGVGERVAERRVARGAAASPALLR